MEFANCILEVEADEMASCVQKKANKQ